MRIVCCDTSTDVSQIKNSDGYLNDTAFQKCTIT